MGMDYLQNQLQAALRFALDNPTEEAKVSLIAELEAFLEANPTAQQANDSPVWWWHKITDAVRLFHQRPTKAGYEQVTRMCRYYLELVNSGIFKPVIVSRKREFSNRYDWYLQELEDRATLFVVSPTVETKRVLEDQLENYAKSNNVRVA